MPRRPGLGRALGAFVPKESVGQSTKVSAGAERDAAVVVHASGNPRDPGRISQPHFALPAVFAAAEPAPLKAALDAVNTYGEHYPELLEEIRSACAGKAGEWAGLPAVAAVPMGS